MVLGFDTNLAGVLALHQKSLGSTTYRGKFSTATSAKSMPTNSGPGLLKRRAVWFPPLARRPFYLQNNLMEGGTRQASMRLFSQINPPRMLNVVNVASPYTPSQTREDGPQSAPSPAPRSKG